MPTLYVARSMTLQKWGSDVGLSKNLYKLGCADAGAKEAVEALNRDAFGGVSDWKVIATEKVEDVDEAAAVERLARKEKMVDPALYPRIKGAEGIFKVKLENVQNNLLVRMALAGSQEKPPGKVKPADVAAYLIANAVR